MSNTTEVYAWLSVLYPHLWAWCDAILGRSLRSELPIHWTINCCVSITMLIYIALVQMYWIVTLELDSVNIHCTDHLLDFPREYASISPEQAMCLPSPRAVTFPHNTIVYMEQGNKWQPRRWDIKRSIQGFQRMHCCALYVNSSLIIHFYCF
jgi:hypothetical protein